MGHIPPFPSKAPPPPPPAPGSVIRLRPGEEFGGYYSDEPITVEQARNLGLLTLGMPCRLTITERRCAYCRGPRASERECPSCGATRIEE